VKRFLDSTVLVESCLSASPKFGAADALVNDPKAMTSAHALAEAYATLSGDARLRISPSDAAAMVDDLAERLKIHALGNADYRQLIATAPTKGICGGGIYDALHAQTARLCHCTEIHTLNIGHFKHVAPDLVILGL
jgi:hypothetical protein